ncbi:hypothetical protein D3C72_2014380 [compost metagenome]
MRQADAGIAGRAFDHRAARPQPALVLGVFEDEARGAVLDRAAGVEEFGLGQDVAAGLIAEPAETQQRRVADAADETFANRHAAPPGVAWERTVSV